MPVFRQAFVAVVVAVTTLASVSSLALADDPSYSGTAVKSVTATLVGTSGNAIGTVQLHQDASGVVLVRVDAAGLPAGAHGMHIHAVGRCEGPAFTSAGGHFNPGAHQHGLNNPAGPHEGDLTQISPSFTGTGTITTTTSRVSLTGGPNLIGDADGSALVIHASADDQLTDPTGNSGGRIACAVLAAPLAVAPSPTLTAPAPGAPSQAPRPPATGTGVARSAANTSGLAYGLIALALISAAAVLLARRR